MSEDDFSRFLIDLPLTTKNDIMKYRNWNDKHASLIGKLLTRYGFGQFGIDIDFEKVILNKFGRPRLHGQIDFNVSHSGNYVLCVFNGNGRVGVDIEEKRPLEVNDFKEQFSKREWLDILSSGDKLELFYDYWTCKEAALKANGSGLNIDLKSIEVNGDHVIVSDKEQWKIKRFSCFDNHKACLAFDSPKSEIRLIEVSINDFLIQ